MKFFTLFTASLASSASALALPVAESAPEQLYTVEIAPGVTKQVTEAQKWELKKASSSPHAM